MSFQTARNYELGLLILNTYLYSLGQGELKQGMSDDDVAVRPWLPLKKIGDLFVLNNYIDKLYSKMLWIYLSPQIYHHHQHFWCKI